MFVTLASSNLYQNKKLPAQGGTCGPKGGVPGEVFPCFSQRPVPGGVSHTRGRALGQTVGTARLRTCPPELRRLLAGTWLRLGNLRSERACCEGGSQGLGCGLLASPRIVPLEDAETDLTSCLTERLPVYAAASIRVRSRPPTPVLVSRAFPAATCVLCFDLTVLLRA